MKSRSKISCLGVLLARAMLMTSLLLVSCHGQRHPLSTAEGLSAASFIGPWQASAVDVSVHGKEGGSVDQSIHYDSKQLAADQGRKPTITLFNGDGSYREEVFNLGDSLVQSKTGFWHFYLDSLYMHLDVDHSPKIAFKSELQGKGLKLLSKIDWDGDGAKDDEMIVQLKRP